MKHRSAARVTFAALLIPGTVLLAGCSSTTSTHATTGDTAQLPAVTGDAAKFATILTRYNVTLKDKAPQTAAGTGQTIGRILQTAHIRLFSYDGSTQGNLLVQVADRLTDKARANLGDQIAKTGKTRTDTLPGWAFQLEAPLTKPILKGVIPADINAKIAKNLTPILPGGYQTFSPDNKSVTVTFAGSLKNGGKDIEAARTKLAVALGAKDLTVVARPLP